MLEVRRCVNEKDFAEFDRIRLAAFNVGIVQRNTL